MCTHTQFVIVCFTQKCKAVRLCNRLCLAEIMRIIADRLNIINGWTNSVDLESCTIVKAMYFDCTHGIHNRIRISTIH